jgi:putative DNA primase/helicase
MTATANDYADAANELGDDAVAASFATAIPQAQFPKGFTMNAKGLFLETEKDGPRKLTGPFDVIAQTRDRYSQAWGVLLRWRDDDGELHQLSIARAQLAGDGREVRQALLHGGLYVSPFNTDRNALQTFLASVKISRRARAVSRVGWQDGAFALPDRTIEQGGGDLVVYQGSAALDHDFRSAGTLEDWQDSVARLGAGNTRLAISLCAAFVGPLLEAVGAEGGGLHLRGQSSIGKSTALLAAASV